MTRGEKLFTSRHRRAETSGGNFLVFDRLAVLLCRVDQGAQAGRPFGQALFQGFKVHYR